jgi:hypothetical protein
MKLRLGWVFVTCLCLILPALGQNAATSSASVSVPPIIQFSNVATDEGGTPLNGTVNMTFSLYNSSQGAQVLWTETQNVQFGNAGQYSVYLGLTQTNGLPTNLFTSGQAQWLGVKIESQPEQPRVFLVSVPYAMKAGDAATIGGLPPSAFVMAATPAGSTTAATTTPDASAASGPIPATNGDVTGLGTVDYIPIWDSTSDIISSVLYQSGTGSTAKIGINTTTPATTLDVKGGATLRGATSVMGALSLAATGTATASAGKASQLIKQVASAYNSSTSTAVNQTFEWQAEPINNDTSTASGTLNLLFGEASAAPSQTGLSIASNGEITFASGQTFPGTGTITGVTAGTDLTGGGTSGTVTLSLNTSALNSTYAKLAAANAFTGNQTVNGNLSATGVVTGSSYQIGSNLFAFGSYANGNAFLGFGGNTTTTGYYNTAVGPQALLFNTTGLNNTAVGLEALYGNTAGSGNVAIGNYALTSNTTGGPNDAFGFEALAANTFGGPNDAFGYRALYSNNAEYNDAFGYEALYSNTEGTYNDAFGYQALYSGGGQGYKNNAFGYQALYNGNGGTFNAAFGYQALFNNASGTSSDAFGDQALYSNTAGYENDAVGFQTLYSNTAGYENDAVGYQALYSNTGGIENTAVGVQALYSNVGSTEDGVGNAAFGYQALYANTEGGGNVAVGVYTLPNTTTGNYNTAVGDLAGGSYTGSENTCIGYLCGSGLDGISNSTAIGAHAVVGQSNSLVLGGTGQYAVKVGIGTTTPSNILTIGRGLGHPVSDSWETYSSRRWKTNIHTLDGALGKVEQLRGVSYDLKDSGKHEIGVIAEEVGAVVPEIVSYEQNGKDAAGVDYSRLTALLIEATKEQQALVRRQQAQIRALQAQLKVQQAKGKLQDTRMAELTSQLKAVQISLNQISLNQVSLNQVSLERNGRTNTQVRTAKATVPMLPQ